jgi:hypothetical protein
MSLRIVDAETALDERGDLCRRQGPMGFEDVCEALSLVWGQFRWPSAAEFRLETCHAPLVPVRGPPTGRRLRDTDAGGCFGERIAGVEIFDEAESAYETRVARALGRVDCSVDLRFISSTHEGSSGSWHVVLSCP